LSFALTGAARPTLLGERLREWALSFPLWWELLFGEGIERIVALAGAKSIEN